MFSPIFPVAQLPQLVTCQSRRDLNPQAIVVARGIMGQFPSGEDYLCAQISNENVARVPEDGLAQDGAPVAQTVSEQQAYWARRLEEGRSIWKSGDRTLALSVFKELINLDPDNVETRHELAEMLADVTLFDEARDQLNIIQQARPSWVTVYLTRGELEQQAQNDLSALKAFDQALAIEPENRFAWEGRLLTLSRLGLPRLALHESKKVPELDPGIIQRLHEDEAALAVRRSENVYHEHPAAAIPDADNALELIETNIKRYPESERSRLDYVRALTNRRRYRDAISIYETLKAEKGVLPGYTHQSAAVSYLSEQQPEYAVEAFKAALETDPNNFSAGVGLFFALCDLSDFASAKAHIDAWAARPLEPDEKFEAEMLAIWVSAYEDRLDIAQDGFLALQARAPASVALHNALGRIYLWRGWPRHATEEFSFSARKNPDDIEAQSGLADADMALGDFTSAAHRISHLSTLTAEGHDGVKRLTRAQALRYRPELTMSSGSRRNKERMSSGRSLRLDTRLYSAPITPQNRMYAHQYYESTEFDSTSAYYKRVGLGWESVIARTAKLDIEFQHELSKGTQSSLLLAGEIEFSDFWRLKSGYDWNSIDVPLRARISDIEGEAVYVGGSFRKNERATVEITARRLTMSDSNDRRSVSASGEYQFIQGPFYKANAALSVSSSVNSLANAAYFNPTRDRTLQVTLKNEWLEFRRYDRAFYQRMYLSAGSYIQHAFATQNIGSIRYEHEWNFSDALNMRYDLAYVRAAYDGEPSTGPELSLSINWKF